MMDKHLHWLCWCVLATPAVQAQEWVWQNPLPQGNSLYAVRFADAQTGYTVGDGGTILKTTDGGASWFALSTGTRSQLTGVHFVGSATGYAVGNEGTILKTTNAGSAWVKQYVDSTVILSSVSFADANRGCAVGGAATGVGSTVLRTTDGGSHWLSVSVGTSNQLVGVFLAGVDTGYAVGVGGTILKTVNGGESWQSQASGTFNWLQSVLCTSADVGYVAGVSLAVGGIGIMNIMLVSVTERTKEIGIRMAVGACRQDILMQFLTEATVLSLAAGIVGVLLGVAVSSILDSFTSLSTALSPAMMFVAFVFSAAVGVFFGFYPAHKAARMNPIDALRYE